MDIKLEKTKNKFDIDIFTIKLKPENPGETLLLKDFEDNKTEYIDSKWENTTFILTF